MKKIIVLFIIVLNVNFLIADIVFDVPFDPNIIGDPYIGEDYDYESPTFSIINNGETDTFTIATSNGIVPDGWYWLYCEVDGGLCHMPGWPFDVLIESGDSLALVLHIHVTSTGSISINFTAGAPSVPDSVSIDFNFQTENQAINEKPNLNTASYLKSNSPNPFKDFTEIKYNIPASYADDLKIGIYNILGQPVKIFSDLENSGSIVWNGKDEMNRSVTSGVYFYKLIGIEQAQTRKLLLIR